MHVAQNSFYSVKILIFKKISLQTGLPPPRFLDFPETSSVDSGLENKLMDVWLPTPPTGVF